MSKVDIRRGSSSPSIARDVGPRAGESSDTRHKRKSGANPCTFSRNLYTYRYSTLFCISNKLHPLSIWKIGKPIYLPYTSNFEADFFLNSFFTPSKSEIGYGFRILVWSDTCCGVRKFEFKAFCIFWRAPIEVTHLNLETLTPWLFSSNVNFLRLLWEHFSCP